MAVMSEESVILVDEMMLPNMRVPWQAVDLDVSLMATLAAMERSERQWVELFQEVGLRIERRFTYEEETGHSVMVVVPNDR